VAFDLDGTLIDSRLDIAAACNHVLVGAGRAELAPDLIATFVGDGVRALVARAFAMPMDAPALGPLEAAFVERYAAHPLGQTVWLPGALAAVDALRGMPMPLAIVTNKARSVTLAVLDGLGARDRFAFVYAGGDGPLKPHPGPILAVADALSVAPQELWVVGDGEQDVRAARAAGAVAIAVLGGFTQEARLREAGPDALLSSLAELQALVERG
jgi:phosphoglycolate phosphatase